MLSNRVFEYCEYIQIRLAEIIRNQTNQLAIEQAAETMIQRFMEGGNVFAYGPTHAGMFAEEMFYRAGGLAITNPLFHPGLMCNVRPATLTSTTESLVGFATAILKESPIRPRDSLIIHSVAARNPVVVEMAREARKRGIFVVGIINMNYATQVTSRDPSGKMMYEECDIVIDTKGDLGDSCIKFPGVEQKVAPASTVLGSFIANVLILQMCDSMLRKGMTPPVFQSANIDGGAEYNQWLLDKFKDRIFYM